MGDFSAPDIDMGTFTASSPYSIACFDTCASTYHAVPSNILHHYFVNYSRLNYSALDDYLLETDFGLLMGSSDVEFIWSS